MPRKDANPGQPEAAAERREEAFRLRKLGLGYRAIAERLGVSTTQAFGDVKSVLRELTRRTTKAAAELRQLESERLDLLWRRLLPGVRVGDPKAVGAAVRVVQRRCSLLGLDAPKKHEHTGTDGGPIRQTVQGTSLDDFRKLPTEDKVRLLRGAMGAPEGEPS